MSRSVLFVCLGNICRSPLAEAAFRKETERLGLEVEIDSAGTGHWHLGRPLDSRATAVAARNGIRIEHLRARQVTRDDFYRFDHIVALDAQNLTDLQRLQPPDAPVELLLLLDHAEGRGGQPVRDPYYEPDEGFDDPWADVTVGARALARRIAADA